jgi:hypothetical protein
MKLEYNLTGVVQRFDFETGTVQHYLELEGISGRHEIPTTEDVTTALISHFVTATAAPAPEPVVTDVAPHGEALNADLLESFGVSAEPIVDASPFAGLGDIAEAATPAPKTTSQIVEERHQERRSMKEPVSKQRLKAMLEKAKTVPQRRVPHDEAGNPIVRNRVTEPAPPEPKQETAGDDSGFSQG